MRFEEFELLVNEACSGALTPSNVGEHVDKLKSAKAAAVRAINALPDGAERKAAFKRLHSLQYRLYKAIVCINLNSSERQYRDFGVIANMVICYDCK